MLLNCSKQVMLGGAALLFVGYGAISRGYSL
jgi:hypothetical protein